MKYTLHYYPSHSDNRQDYWEFDTKQELSKELYKHICQSCKDGSDELYFQSRGVYNELDFEGMISTPCGCEWGAFLIHDDGTEESL